jgi:hypothetical protein
MTHCRPIKGLLLSLSDVFGDQHVGRARQVYDLWSLAEEYGYSKEAREVLNQARHIFMKEFEARHPGVGQGRAVWE